MVHGQEPEHIVGIGVVNMKTSYDLGIITIKILYNNFQKYFESGDIIISGSFFYKKLGCLIETDYKDVDIIIDNNISNDYILYEIQDFFKSNYEIISTFIERYDGLIGCIHADGLVPIDLLRNDFSENISNIEIIPGVFTNYRPYYKMVDVYDKLLIQNPTNVKYKQIKKFYESF